MDIVYPTATSDHQGVSQERVSTLLHLHWYTCPLHLLVSFVVGCENITVHIYKGTIRMVYWWVEFFPSPALASVDNVRYLWKRMTVEYIQLQSVGRNGPF